MKLAPTLVALCASLAVASAKAAEPGLPDPDAHRRAYVDYLATRLEAPRAFVEEADRARAA